MTQKETNVCKGLGIVFLYLHHLCFYSEALTLYQVSFFPFSADIVGRIAYALKFCVSMFVFLTAYGTTVQYRQRGITTPLCAAQYSLARYLKLITGFWVVYLFSQVFCFFGMDTLATYGEPGGKRIFSMSMDLLGVADWWGTPTLNVTWWYLSLAVLLIFMMPIFIAIVQKVGLLSIPIALFLLSSLGGYLSSQLLAIVCGVVFARFHILERLRSACKGNRSQRLRTGILLLLGFFCFCFLLWYRSRLSNEGAVESMLAVLGCTLCYVFLAPLPVVNHTLAFLGKHSMNLFLLHTFVYLYYGTPFIYSFKHIGLIFLVLLGVTLAMSLCIEGFKRLIRLDKGVAFLIQKSNAALACVARGENISLPAQKD